MLPPEAVHPAMPVSKLGFGSIFTDVGWVQLHEVPAGQQRPPQEPLAQSLGDAHTCPSAQRHCVPLQTLPVAHALPHTPQLLVVLSGAHALLQHP
jgi:hypothetical protein